jgi:hypoxanthine phosphoribosyltransferase
MPLKDKIKIRDRYFAELYSELQLRIMISECASKIKNSFTGNEDLVVIGVLNGAVPFLNELVFNLPPEISIDYVKAVSYGDNTFSSGTVRLIMDTELDLKGKTVLLVDDIIDTGKTINFLKEHFLNKGALQVKTACLFYKKNLGVPEPDFYGHEIGDGFIVGFGLDYAQKGRNMRKILRIIE